MPATRRSFLLTFLCAGVMVPLHAQGVRLGKALVADSPSARNIADHRSFEAFVCGEAAPVWKKSIPGVELHLFRADRGVRKGGYLLVWTAGSQEQLKPYLAEGTNAPFSKSTVETLGTLSKPHSAYLNESGSFTEYELVGADRIGELPSVEILGIHYMKVKPEARSEFERFVRDRVHPVLVGTIPGMSLLYYKGIRGKEAGTYITIFAIESIARREQYWPTDASESAAVKAAFRPHTALAQELTKFLVPGSYLETSSGMAAAGFESKEWTDFVRVDARAH